MRKLIFIIFFSICYYQIFAQGFSIAVPPNPSAFTSKFLTIINDASNDFSHLKGKKIHIKDTIHLASNIYNVTLQLPNSTAGRLVTDSTIYTEYYFGDFETISAAFEAYDTLQQHVAIAIDNRKFIKDYHVDTNGTVVRLEKIAYAINRGFYHYNIALQIIRLLHNNKFRVLLQIYNGKPQFYYRIMKNEPISSFNMITVIRTNLAALQDQNITGCPITVPPFRCLGKRIIQDTLFITYQKPDFDDYPTARTEFDVYMSNIRVSLGSQYVFYSVPCPSEGPVFKRWAFIHINDLETYKRKTVLLSLVAMPELVMTEKGMKTAFAIQLDFAY